MISDDINTDLMWRNCKMRKYTFDHEIKFNEYTSHKMLFTKLKNIKLKYWNKRQMHKIKIANSKNKLVSRFVLIPNVWSAVLM